MRVLVCGGRDFCEGRAVVEALGPMHRATPFSAIIHGAARGADYLAGAWARWMQVPELPFPADWERDGRAAGPIRNQRMLDEGKPDLVVAFPGGRGTADMIRRARKAGLRVIEVAEPTPGADQEKKP